MLRIAVVSRRINIGNSELLLRSSSSEDRRKSMATADEGIKGKQARVPGREDATARSGSPDVLNGVREVRGREVRGQEAVGFEAVKIAKLGFLESNDRGSSSDKRILNYSTFVRVV